MSSPSITVFVAMAPIELGLWGLWIACGTGREKRPLFRVRVLLASLALPSLVAALVLVARLNAGVAANALMRASFLLGVVALMLVPGLLYRMSEPSPGSSESDDGGGPGRGPPRSPPDAPRGGVPLSDADQARARVRDHNKPKFDEPKRRRRAHPERTPTPTSG